MKSASILLLIALSVICVAGVSADESDEDCGSDAVFKTSGFACKFTCSPDGVIFDCNAPGCQCNNGDLYFNTATRACEPVNCENLSCVGKENEKFFNDCQSGSREVCGSGCSQKRRWRQDCQRTCLCEDGFCRENGVCVKENCEK